MQLSGLTKREENEQNENILSNVRMLVFIFCVIDIVGIHCIISPFRLYWYGELYSFATISFIGISFSIVVYVLFYYLLEKKQKNTEK